mmetsp:Transcript_10176/g.35643  ORF Transcript_10176/g.35643 Transcript_10176/m.35643 type:complete len:213 (-) Transcript_10176:3-641(-)
MKRALNASPVVRRPPRELRVPLHLLKLNVRNRLLAQGPLLDTGMEAPEAGQRRPAEIADDLQDPSCRQGLIGPLVAELVFSSTSSRVEQRIVQTRRQHAQQGGELGSRWRRFPGGRSRKRRRARAPAAGGVGVGAWAGGPARRRWSLRRSARWPQGQACPCSTAGPKGGSTPHELPERHPMGRSGEAPPGRQEHCAPPPPAPLALELDAVAT